MSVIFLLRHAEAQKAPGQSPDDLFSIADLGLSERGAAQARAAADALAREPIEAVYASRAQRARETARSVAERHGLAVEQDPRFAELHVPGKDYAETLDGILQLPARFRADASTFLAERRAFESALADVAERHARAIVVSHALSVRAFLCAARGIPLDALLTIPMEHAAIVRVERTANGWRA